MADPKEMMRGLMALMHRGRVSLDLSDPPPPAAPNYKSEVPCVRVTANGKTWQQPIRRGYGATQSTPEEIAEALSVAIERCIRGDNG